MRKRIAFIMVTACALLITGCGASNSTADSAETDNQIKVTYVENTEQTDTEGVNTAIDTEEDLSWAIVFAFDVFPVDVDPIPTVVTRLDTSESIMLADGNIIEQSRFENTNVVFGTEVVDVGDMSCQGLSVYFKGDKGQFQEVQRIFYWTDNGWMIISE